MTNKKKWNTRKNFSLVIAFIFTLLLIAVGIYLYKTKLIVPNAQEAVPSLSLSPATKQVDVGSTFPVDINLDTASNAVASVDIHIVFDPQMLEVEDANGNSADGVQIQQGSLFSSYENNQTDNSQGTISLSASTVAQGGFTGAGIFGTITFKALKEGTANVNFDYIPGSTTDWNNIWSETLTPVQDILASVTDGTYTLSSGGNGGNGGGAGGGGGGGGRRTPTPTPTPTPNPTPMPTSEETSENTPNPVTVNTNTPNPTATPAALTNNIIPPYFKSVSFTDSAVLDSAQKRSQGVLIVGTANPSSAVNVTILSTPITATANSDDKGNWSCVVNDWIDDGVHTISGTAEKDGKKSTETTYSFVISSQDKSQIALGKTLPPLAEVTPTATATPAPKNNHNKIIIWTLIALGIVAIGVGIFIFIDKRRKDFDDTNNLITPSS